ncbi:MAG: response regulator transcription factor [Anaerolineae bacterium]|nr:response regulator transcription factor [Anaerolineae bacterium]
MSAYILTVDDEQSMRMMLTDALGSAGYDVETAGSALDALKKLEKRRPDVLVLDIGMPEMDGLTLCRKLRQDPRFVTLPILFLTAFTQPEDIVKGLDAGADDYTLKPINLPVFLARVRALLRRKELGPEDAPTADYKAVLKVGGLELNSDTYQVSVEGGVIQLTATEHRLLRYMMEHDNQPLSPQRLLEAVWEYPPYTGDPDLVRVHVRNLRTKLEADTRQPKYIQTVHGVGYMIQG